MYYKRAFFIKARKYRRFGNVRIIICWHKKSYKKDSLLRVVFVFSEIYILQTSIHSTKFEYFSSSGIVSSIALLLLPQAARPGKTEFDEVNLYNFMVMGMQNYYRIATDISRDCNSLNRSVMTILTNRLRTPSGNRLVKTGRTLTNFEKTAYGKARTMRYVAGTGEPIYPISYVQHRKPMSKKLSVNSYSPDGRQGLHDNLRINTSIMLMLMRQPLHNRSTEYADNRISLYSAQWGKCAITGHEFRSVAEIHCHHATPRSKGGTDKYENLVLILESVHRLIHATRPETINHYKEICSLNVSQMKKLNEFRQKAGLESIA